MIETHPRVLSTVADVDHLYLRLAMRLPPSPDRDRILDLLRKIRDLTAHAAEHWDDPA